MGFHRHVALYHAAQCSFKEHKYGMTVAKPEGDGDTALRGRAVPK